jgi:sarcosine oxidase
MPRSYDIIVVGVGAIGAAACWRLAQRGLKVLGLEGNGVPNAQGSSHGYTRMTRSAYCEHPDYVPLVRRANVLWRELESETGRHLLHLVGALYMGAPTSDLIAGSKRAADEHRLAYESLNRRELAKRFPQFQLPDDYVGLLEAEAGFLRPEVCVACMALQALRSGAEIHGCEPVIEWSEGAGGVTVRTEVATYTADQIILAGGAWSEKLVRSLGVQLTVTRQVLGWVWPNRPALFEPGTIPVWAVGHADGSMHYGFPMLVDNPGLKVAHHSPGPAADPDTLQRTAQPADATTFLPFLKQMVPAAVGPVVAMRICMYALSPDRHFIVDRLPDFDRVTVGCGFSGHGFKFAGAIGEALADYATERRTRLPMAFLSLSRFAGQV